MDMMYYDYYRDDFDISECQHPLQPDYNYMMKKLKEYNISEAEVKLLYSSGYYCLENIDMIVDRFYFGSQLIYDGVSGFHFSEISRLLSEPRSRVWVKHAGSLSEVLSIIEKYPEQHGTLFRGQIDNYLINREINNPFFTIPGLGEVSLLPSLWRIVKENLPSTYISYIPMKLLEWSLIFSQQFDWQNIREQIERIKKTEGHYPSLTELEECDDESLKEYGKMAVDLMYGHNTYYADTLSTLLQHYGLYTPLLDLTEDLNVALFFSTHKFNSRNTSYEFIGNNSGKSVLYLIEYDPDNMKKFEDRENLIQTFKPLRPILQKCVICKSDPFCINLPAMFLKGIIYLDFKISENISGIKPEDIFPNETKDLFLSYISRDSLIGKHVTRF